MPESGEPTSADRVERLFTRSDGRFRFARWGRSPAPVVYGTNDEGVRIVEETLASVAGLAGLELTELDPELGANFMVFFCRDWGELPEVPNLARLIPGLDGLMGELSQAGANQYRLFGFDGAGAIRICITLIRYDAELRRVSAQTLAVSQCLQGLLLWSDLAFAAESPIAVIADTGRCIVKPWFQALIRAAYEPAIPAVSQDASLALRLAARVDLAGAAGGDIGPRGG